MTSTALVPYDYIVEHHDDRGYNTSYAASESASQGYYSPEASQTASDFDYYYHDSPTALTVSSNNELVPYSHIDAINPKHPLKSQMKQQRRRRTAGAAVGGAVLGGLVLGPVGAVLGGVRGAALARTICRTGEKRAVRKFEHSVMQHRAREAAERSTGSFA